MRHIESSMDVTTFQSIPVMYGPKDNFSKETGHVIGSLISRFHDAKERELVKFSAGVLALLLESSSMLKT